MLCDTNLGTILCIRGSGWTSNLVRLLNSMGLLCDKRRLTVPALHVSLWKVEGAWFTGRRDDGWHPWNLEVP